MYGCAGGVAQDLSQRDFAPGGEFSLREFPGNEFVVYVVIERDFALFDFLHRDRRVYRFADRAGLKERLGGNRLFRTEIFHAISLRPHDLKIFDYSNTQAGNFVELHPLFYGPTGLAFDCEWRDKT